MSLGIQSSPPKSSGIDRLKRMSSTISSLAKTSFSSEIFFEDEEVDEYLKNLYPDSNILDQRCQFANYRGSSKAKESLKHSSPELNTIFSKTADSVVEGLSEEYFTPHFDSVKLNLIEVSSWTEDEMVENFMMKIEEADSDKDFILSKLADMIEANYGELMSIVRDANILDLDLTRAGMNLQIGRRKIASASELVEAGSIRIAELYAKKERLSAAADTVRSLKNIRDLHSSMLHYITTGDLGRAAEAARCVLVYTRSGEFACPFTALDNIGLSVQKNLLIIRQKADKALLRLCGRKFASSDYASIIQAYVMLDDIAETMGIDNVQGNSLLSPLEPPFDSHGCCDWLANRISNFQIHDIDNTLQSAILENIYANQHKKSKTAALVEVAGAYSMLETGQMMDLLEAELDELYEEHVTPELVTPCVVRACELLADVVYTYHRISQWHDPQAGGSVAVPQEAETDAETEASPLGSAPEDISAAVNRALNSNINSNGTSQPSGQARLAGVAERLWAGRPSLWAHLEEALVLLLTSVGRHMTAVLPVDDFLAINWAVMAMMALGKEFCNCEGRNVANCMKENNKIYFAKLHQESFSVLRQMLEAESWLSIGTADQLGGVVTLIQKNLISSRGTEIGASWSYRNLRGVALGLDLTATSGSISLLSFFGQHGNPLHYMAAGELVSATGGTLPFSLTIEPQNRPSDGLVVTQTALNGLARYTGRYLQLMAVLPSAASTIFTGLCQLFDYYLCAIFMGFVSAEEKNKAHCGRGNNSNSPSPNVARGFSDLFSYMERALNDVVGYSQGSGSEEEAAPITVSSLLATYHVAMLDNSMFFGLSEKLVAAESVYFAAQLLSAVRSTVSSLLPAAQEAVASGFVKQYQLLAGQLRGLVYRALAPQLIKSNLVMCQLLEAGWDGRRARTVAAEWVERLRQHCQAAWTHLEGPSGLSAMVREQAWLELVQAAWDTVLEGVSRIRRLSAEGKAGLLLDMETLQTTLNSIRPCMPPRGKDYIEGYVLASTMTEPDMMEWVRQCWQEFAYRHIISLLNYTLNSVMSSKRLKDAIVIVDALYEEDRPESKLGNLNLLAGKVREEGSFSRVMGFAKRNSITG